MCNLYQRWFGVNAGVLAVINRLKIKGSPLSIYDTGSCNLYELRGSGRHLSGRGKLKVYDIEIRQLRIESLYRDECVSDWTAFNLDHPFYSRLNMLSEDNINDLNDPGELKLNDPDFVISTLRKIAGRLKQYQGYPLGRLTVTSDLITSKGYQFICNGFKLVVPTSMVSTTCFITNDELSAEFNPNLVKVMDQEKILRQHRHDTDPKRWYIISKIESATKPYVVKFTPRKSGVDKVAMYAIDLHIDSRNQGGKPFYVTELIKDAIQTLSTKHPDHSWDIKLYNDAIKVHVFEHPKLSITEYTERQDKWPEHVDHNPILIDDVPVVKHGVGEFNLYNTWKIVPQAELY